MLFVCHKIFVKHFWIMMFFSFFLLSIGCSLSEEVEIGLFVESRDEKGDIVPDTKIILNGIEKGITDKKGQFNGAIKTKVGKDITLKAEKGEKEWKTMFKIYPKINDIRAGRADKGSFEGDISLNEEVVVIAESHQKGEYRFIAILSKE
ncbi:MAG: hypothetical protein A2Z50_02400 [Nitrospirae bacterium RBG_19FT_COMBO_42_15]|nr:MAG: hypothetical protein A2Z50_02400 [Nitrospirae bacterium RBG_19FT_COMBO_42_15]